MERKTVKTTITNTGSKPDAKTQEIRSDFVAAYCLDNSNDEAAIEASVYVCGRMGTQEVVSSLAYSTVDVIIEAEDKPEERASLYLAYLNVFVTRIKEADPEAAALLLEGGPDA